LATGAANSSKGRAGVRDTSKGAGVRTEKGATGGEKKISKRYFLMIDGMVGNFLCQK
jgi:hypothetical protein